jgi:transposase
MTIYAVFDVSSKTTSLCVVDGDDAVMRRDVVMSDPDIVVTWLKRHCAGLVRVVLETGPLSTFLYRGLIERGIPVVGICARHARKALSARVNKSDANDAESLAQLCRTGWFKAVHMKAGATHIDRAALKIRALLMSSRNAFANQLRGMLKLFGLRMGTVTKLRCQFTEYTS